jgi:hypothetical protein
VKLARSLVALRQGEICGENYANNFHRDKNNEIKIWIICDALCEKALGNFTSRFFIHLELANFPPALFLRSRSKGTVKNVKVENRCYQWTLILFMCVFSFFLFLFEALRFCVHSFASPHSTHPAKNFKPLSLAFLSKRSFSTYFSSARRGNSRQWECEGLNEVGKTFRKLICNYENAHTSQA